MDPATAAVVERIVIVLALVAGSIGLAFGGFESLAATAMGGALATIIPATRAAPAPRPLEPPDTSG